MHGFFPLWIVDELIKLLKILKLAEEMNNSIVPKSSKRRSKKININKKRE
jgi:hypothetical protein